MAKGTSVERMSQFIRDASGAGISVRTSMMVGYPGETARDVDDSVRFVETHEPFLDRISLARFKAIPGTRFHEFYERTPERYRDLLDFAWNLRYGRAHYQYADASHRSHRRSTARLLKLVHRINSKPLRHEAQPFMGLM
jgi:radical SAM superfamily enzyme YgiQ (UPF0313 family)